MRSSYQLTSSQPTQQVRLDNFRASMLFVENPTGSVVLVNVGGNDVPTAETADHRVPSGSFLLVPVEGTIFAASLADPTSATIDPSGSNLLTRATVWLLSADELPPSFGAASYQTLSLSPLTPGVATISGATTSPAYDLGSWGGAIFYLALSPGSGQAFVTVQQSADQLTWYTVGRWSAWPDVPVTISVPRVLRYCRLVVAATSIPSAPALAGSFAARASLQEITQAAYSAGSASLSIPYSVVAGGTVTVYAAASALPGVSAALVNTAGTSVLTATVYTAEGFADWAQVSQRTQTVNTTTLATIFRSYGDLRNYLRIDLTNAGGSTISGTLTLAIQSQADLTGYLERIGAALGDANQPTSADTIFRRLANIDANTDTAEALLTNIQASVAATATNTTSLNARIGAGDITVLLTALQTLLTTAQTDRRTFTEYFFYPAVVSTAGTFVGYNVLGSYSGRYIVSAQIGLKITGARTGSGVVIVGLGNSGGVNQYIYRIREEWERPAGQWPTLAYNDGPLGGGIQMTPGRDYLWVYSDSPAEIDVFLVIR